MKLWRVAILALLVVGCSSVDKTVFETFPPRADDASVGIHVSPDTSPDVLRSAVRGTPPGRPIGTIVMKSRTAVTWKEVLTDAKVAAREMGGDAILIEDGEGPEGKATTFTATVYRR